MKVINKKKVEKVEVSVEEAAKVLQEAQEAKMNACAEEVSKVLEKHGFGLSVSHQIVLVPKQA